MKNIRTLQNKMLLLVIAIIGAVLGVTSISEFYLFTQDSWGLWGLIPPFLALILGKLTHAHSQHYSASVDFFSNIAMKFGGIIFGIFGLWYSIVLLAMALNIHFYL